MGASVQKSGTIDGIRWNASIEATSGGQFTIRAIDVTDSEGKTLPTYTERTAVHDDVEAAVEQGVSRRLSVLQRAMRPNEPKGKGRHGALCVSEAGGR